MSDDSSSSPQDPKERLVQDLGTCYSSDLRAHLARDAVIVVAGGLDLLEVAVSVAQDQAERVQKWIDSGKLQKPSLAQLELWNTNDHLPFHSVVVRPYVLVQERTN